MHTDHVHKVLDEAQERLDVVTHLDENEKGEKGQRRDNRKKEAQAPSVVSLDVLHFYIITMYRFPAYTSVQLILILSKHSASECKQEKKNTLLAAMQPQNFLKSINGQAVDSYSGFSVHRSLSLTVWKEGRACVSLTQICRDVGAKVCACMQCAVSVP